MRRRSVFVLESGYLSWSHEPRLRLPAYPPSPPSSLLALSPLAPRSPRSLYSPQRTEANSIRGNVTGASTVYAQQRATARTHAIARSAASNALDVVLPTCLPTCSLVRSLRLVAAAARTVVRCNSSLAAKRVPHAPATMLDVAG